MDSGGDSSSRSASLYGDLLDRFNSLEASHAKLREQLDVLLHDRATTEDGTTVEVTSDTGDMTSFHVPSGACFSGTPYRSVLEYMGHALHVTTSPAGEIVFWNSAAEKLFGYKDHEAVGQRDMKLLFEEEHHPLALAIMERLSTGDSWSGQLPLKMKSSKIFMAMVTKSPLYEDGELVGVVTVSSDAAVFNDTNSRNFRTSQDHANEQSKVPRINLKKIQWHPQSPHIAAVPQLASSVSNLASKVLSRKNGDVKCNSCKMRESEESEVENQDSKADRPPRAPPAKPAFSLFRAESRAEAMNPEKEESAFARPLKNAAKVFSRFHIGAISNLEKTKDENIQQNGSKDKSRDKEVTYGTCHPSGSTESTSHIADASNYDEYVANERKKINSMVVEDGSPGQSDSHKLPSSGESFGSGHGSSSSRSENDPNMVVDCGIRWEDLLLREEIGQGSYAVVYRGIWHGADVAVKVYFGNQYREETLLDYKKEIDIMRRLRHPNVLLFMGAVCSQEKLAIVTEYLTRGSLFGKLHRSNQSLDIKRRLRMAIDVARGMNYLHHRNPPIVHRDLKSSNLLVDKSWTVKVGDFGLSKLKNSTFLTAKSGRGTPQWMAPEVLRNELSTEKSDVFSFGVILWELMTECIPWNNLNSLQVVGVVGFMNRRLDIPADMDPQVSSIISDCWDSNPEKRPSFEDLIHRMTEIFHGAARVTARTVSTP